MSNSEEHDSLFEPVKRFYRQNENVPDHLILTEPGKKLGVKGEVPDLLVFWHDLLTTEICDVKVRYDDCVEHCQKPHVQNLEHGMGARRWVFTPASLDRVVTPPGWGHRVIHEDGSVETRYEAPFFKHHQRNVKAERDRLDRHIEALYYQRGGTGADRNNGTSTQARLTADEAAAVRNALADLGMANAKEIAWWIQANAKTSKTKLQLRNHIGEDVRNGRLEGVAVANSHNPVRLTLAGDAAQEVTNATG